MYTSVSKIFAFGLLVSAPLANALAIPSQSQDLARSVDSLEARHHTEAQIAVSFLTQRRFRVVLIPERRKRRRQPKALVTSSLRLAITLKRKS
jgi:diketogulonate reductase-like aldo/keto reductase